MGRRSSVLSNITSKGMVPVLLSEHSVNILLFDLEHLKKILLLKLLLLQ